MKFILKRRKHRKGIRPVRKGALKVKIRQLPVYLDQLFYSSAILDKTIELLEKLMTCSIDRKRRQELENAYGFWKTQYEQARKGDQFLKLFEQVEPVDLALDVINYVDPVYSKPETMDEKCARCPIGGSCSFKNYREPEHRFRWCPMGQGGKFLAPNVKELTTSEMAGLALTHLS